MKPNQPIVPISYSKEAAAAAFGTSVQLIDRWMARPVDPLPAWRDGKRILIPVREAQDWIGRQAANGIGNE